MLGKGYLCAVVTQDAWQTPTTNMDMVRSEEGVQKRIAFRASIGRKSIPDGNLGEQMQRLHGQAAPASSSSLGSRQGLWPTARSLDGMVSESLGTWEARRIRKAAEGINLHRPLPIAVMQEQFPTPRACDWKSSPDADSNIKRMASGQATLGEFVHAKEKQWRTPQANEAGARVETLYTKDGQPARPGERAYRKTPDGRMVLQSQTINQQVEMVQNWATPSNSMTAGRSEQMNCRAGREGYGHVGNHLLRQTGNAGKLNPRWVETLMGLPVGWVMPSCASPVTIAPMSCDSSAMELCQPQQSELFEF
jgi:hypothetical protein